MNEKNLKHGLTSPHGGDGGGGDATQAAAANEAGERLGLEGDEVDYIDDAEAECGRDGLRECRGLGFMLLG
jgi:hypothetical protein